MRKTMRSNGRRDSLEDVTLQAALPATCPTSVALVGGLVSAISEFSTRTRAFTRCTVLTTTLEDSSG